MIADQKSSPKKHLEIPDYRCAGPVQLSTVNHVRRGTEQH